MSVDIIGLFLLLIIVINSMNNYLKRKNEGLKFLSKFIDNNFQYAHLISSSNVISLKEQITKEIRNKNSTKYYHELTNKDRMGFKVKSKESAQLCLKFVCWQFICRKDIFIYYVYKYLFYLINFAFK